MEATSGILDSIVSLPSGGGALRSLGERFQPDPVRGTGNFGIPIDLPSGPADLKPGLSLRYSSGQGNGLFGMGWQLTGPLAISRRTDRGVPRYDDALDEFVLGGAETLVPVGGGRYRPRTDTQGWLIRREDECWTIRSKDGARHVLGATAAGRVDGPGGTFTWLVEEQRDRAGNRIEYRWEIEDGFAYLAEIAWSIFAVRFTYEARPDRLYQGRGGFEQVATKRCARIDRLTTSEAQPVTGRYCFTYEQAPGSAVSLLTEVQLQGVSAEGSLEAHPAVRMSYTPFAPGRQPIRRLRATGSFPPSLDQQRTALIDMDGDGLPDLLETGGGAHRWWPNRGDAGFGAERRVTEVPAGMTLGAPGVSFADLDGDGTVDLFRADPRLSLTVSNTGRGAWAERPQVVRRQLPLNLSATDSRLVDLDGDGVPDLLQSSKNGFLIAYNRGAEGWSEPQVISRRMNPDRVPTLNLGAAEAHLADLNGDGLIDLAFIASGRAEYWPSLGRGRFGSRVAMRNAPRLPARYDPDRVYLTDLDGDGAADLLYIDHDRVLFWINQSGGAWSDRFEVPFIPPPGAASVTLVDMFGEGTAGLLWSMRPAHGHDTGYRFLSLHPPVKPYLLSTVDDGIGGVTEIRYGSSAAERARDADSGEDWNTFLPFPLQVVTEITHRDRASGRVNRTRLRYHRGHYDGHERELRGFERVEQELDGDGHAPTVVQEFVFDQTGAHDALDVPSRERARRRALAGSMIEIRTWEVDGEDTRVLRQHAEIEWAAREEFVAGDDVVHLPHMVRSVAREIAIGGAVRIESAEYGYDEFGNLNRKLRRGLIEGAADPPLELEQTITYVRNESEWLVGLPASVEARGEGGVLLQRELHFYDGAPFTGLPNGEATRGLLRRTRELVLRESALPDGYRAQIDPAWNLMAVGADWYRDSAAYDHDARGNVVAQRDPFSRVTTITYDDDGLFPVRQEDAGGFVTECAFDARTAQPREVRQPDGRSSRFVYSPLGRLRAHFETGSDGALSLAQAYSVDFGDFAAGVVRPPRIVSIRPVAPGREPAEFPDGLDPASVTDASVACDYYDSAGNLLERLVRSDDGPDGSLRWIARERRSYSVRGTSSAEYPNERRASPAFVAPGGTLGVRFFFDGLNQLVRVERPDGTRLSVRFLGDRLEKRDASTADDGAATVERYNAWGQLVAVEQPDGAGSVSVTSYGRDALGRITAITDASGRRLLDYVYAGPGPAVRIEHADAGVRTYWRDARGSVRLRGDSLGRRLVMRYDDVGRLSAVVDATDPAQPSTVRSLVYEDTRLVEAIEGSVRASYAYDAAGLTTHAAVEVDGETLAVQYEYTYDGQIAALVYPDGTRVNYEQGAGSMVASIPGIVDAVEYDQYGSPTAIRFAGGPFTEYSFDPLFHRMERAALRTSAGTLRELTLGYDANGCITSLIDQLPTETLARRFTHDGIYRLTRTEILDGTLDGTLIRADGYAYSPTGDMLRNDETLTGPMRYEDDAHAGRLTGFQQAGAADPESVAYDGAGRMTSLGVLTDLRYDVFDRLTQATAPDGAMVRFAYDHRGVRVKKEVVRAGTTSVTRNFGTLFERSPAGTRLHFYVGKLLVAVRSTPDGGASATHYVLTDHLGSILAGCDADGAERTQQLYSAFGIPTHAPGAHDRYIGLRAEDDLGISQFGARYYCPAIGRFLTPDWFIAEDPGRSLRMPQGLNAYSYSLNNPLALSDPSGLWFGIDDLIAAAVGFVVGFVAGIVHGIASGHNFGDTLLNGLEGGLLGAVGGWLAWNTLGLAAAAFKLAGVAGFTVSGFLAGAGGGLLTLAGAGIFLNSIVSGMMQIYEWRDWSGWTAFLVDYSWGLVGTALGGLLIYTNLFYGANSRYRQNQGRQNRHVYDGGFGIPGFAFTQGNVTSNMNGGSASLLDHEGLHTFQSRLFGPLYQATYVARFLVGSALGILITGPIAAAANGENYGEAILDVNYRNIPWEEWAYCSENPSASGHRGGMFSRAC